MTIKDIKDKGLRLRYRDTPYCIRPCYTIINKDNNIVGEVDLRTVKAIEKIVQMKLVNGFYISEEICQQKN